MHVTAAVEKELSKPLKKDSLTGKDETIYDLWRLSETYVRNVDIYTPKFRNVIMEQDYLYNAAKEQVALWQTKIRIMYREFRAKFPDVKQEFIKAVITRYFVVDSKHNYGVYNIKTKKYDVVPVDGTRQHEYGFDGKKFLKLKEASLKRNVLVRDC